MRKTYGVKVPTGVRHVCIGADLVRRLVPLEDVWADVGEALQGLAQDVDAVIQVLDAVQPIGRKGCRSRHCERIPRLSPLGVVKIPH